MIQANLRGRKDLLILAATQILVAAVTIAVLFFPHRRSSAEASAKNAMYLNELAEEFHRRFDRWPSRNGGVWELAVNGYIDYKTNRIEYHQLYEDFRWNKKTLRFELNY